MARFWFAKNSAPRPQGFARRQRRIVEIEGQPVAGNEGGRHLALQFALHRAQLVVVGKRMQVEMAMALTPAVRQSSTPFFQVE